MEPQQIGKALTVGEVAARSGVAVSTLHYYEARGLIRSSRSRGNQRRYARDVLRRVSVIKVAQRCLSMRNCWLRNPWDELSRQGPGPRLLD